MDNLGTTSLLCLFLLSLALADASGEDGSVGNTVDFSTEFRSSTQPLSKDLHFAGRVGKCRGQRKAAAAGKCNNQIAAHSAEVQVETTEIKGKALEVLEEEVEIGQASKEELLKILHEQDAKIKILQARVGTAVHSDGKPLRASAAPEISGEEGTSTPGPVEIEDRKGKGTPDLDWPGCKAWTRWGCAKKEGCEHKYIWLDTWRQSCRYSDEHKLLPDQVSKFFPVELARLEEKSTKFAKTGCVYGGWWMKCQRRMTQILRLFSYVNKAHNQVLREGAEHPAYKLVATEAIKARISQITENMGTGFSKHSTSKKFCFEAAMRKMAQIPAKVAERKEAAIKAGEPLSDDELTEYEKAQQSAAMMEMTCTEVTEEQAQELQAQIESSGDLKDSQNDLALDTSVDAAIQANSDALKEVEDSDRKKLENDPDDSPDGDVDTEIDDHDDLEPPSLVNASLVEQHGALQGTGQGPVKWLFRNGLGWILARTMWLIIFMLGSVFSIFRAAVLFPMMFIGCFLMKTLGWLFDDVMIGFLWEGDTSFLKTAKEPFKCAPWMWQSVGFKTGEGSVKDTLGQIVVQPASFASTTTGVYHPYKQVDPCEDVTCGNGAHCSVGKCFCKTGLYPVTGTPDCAQVVTSNGCVCTRFWTSGIFDQKHHGCASSGKCRVDTLHPSYNTCKQKLKKTGLGGILSTGATGSRYKSHDHCVWKRAPHEVPKGQMLEEGSMLQQLDNQSHSFVVAEASHKPWWLA